MLSRFYHKRPFKSLLIVRRVIPDYIHLADEDSTPNRHGNGDDGKIHSCKIEAVDVDVLAGEYVSPEKTCQGRTESRAEGTVIDTERHSVHSGPECPVANGNAVLLMDCLPCLDDSAKENGGTYISACELSMRMAG